VYGRKFRTFISGPQLLRFVNVLVVQANIASIDGGTEAQHERDSHDIVSLLKIIWQYRHGADASLAIIHRISS